MDVVGMNPKNEDGKYFHANSCEYLGLAAPGRTMREVAPAETKPCEHWFLNDGDGLHANYSERLADRLEKVLAAGSLGECIRSLPELLFEEEMAVGTVLETAFGACGDAPWIMAEARIGDPESVPVWRLREAGPEIAPARPVSGQKAVSLTGGPPEDWRRQLREVLPSFIRFLRASGGFEIW
jgi:hypothetical protein